MCAARDPTGIAAVSACNAACASWADLSHLLLYELRRTSPRIRFRLLASRSAMSRAALCLSLCTASRCLRCQYRNTKVLVARTVNNTPRNISKKWKECSSALHRHSEPFQNVRGQHQTPGCLSFANMSKKANAFSICWAFSVLASFIVRLLPMQSGVSLLHVLTSTACRRHRPCTV